MPKLKEEMATLKNQDTYSLMLFVLFKLRDIPEYSTLSELINSRYFNCCTTKILT